MHVWFAGPKACKNPDPYMAPLIEELKELWIGVRARDASDTFTTGVEPTFTLRAMVIWTIHDWPGEYIHAYAMKAFD